MSNSYQNMRLTKFNPTRGEIKGAWRDKPLLRAYVAIDLRDGTHIIDCRTYYPQSVCYALLWAFGKNVYATGSGKAGGYGYCKKSSAVGYALRNAGFEFDSEIAGLGDEAIRDALKILAMKLAGTKKVTIVESCA